MQRRVVCAANKASDGTIFAGARHFDDVMRTQISIYLERQGKDITEVSFQQGFIDQRGVFMTRVEAWAVAEASGQIRERVGGDSANGGTLYSENLY